MKDGLIDIFIPWGRLEGHSSYQYRVPLGEAEIFANHILDNVKKHREEAAGPRFEINGSESFRFSKVTSFRVYGKHGENVFLVLNDGRLRHLTEGKAWHFLEMYAAWKRKDADQQSG